MHFCQCNHMHLAQSLEFNQQFSQFKIVESIINHPSFRALLNILCDQSSSSSGTSTRETINPRVAEPQYFRGGFSHRQSARPRQRMAIVPCTRGPNNNRPRKREIFRSKEVLYCYPIQTGLYGYQKKPVSRNVGWC